MKDELEFLSGDYCPIGAGYGLPNASPDDEVPGSQESKFWNDFLYAKFKVALPRTKNLVEELKAELVYIGGYTSMM